jgi:hypothetical protein
VDSFIVHRPVAESDSVAEVELVTIVLNVADVGSVCVTEAVTGIVTKVVTVSVTGTVTETVSERVTRPVTAVWIAIWN